MDFRKVFILVSSLHGCRLEQGHEVLPPEGNGGYEQALVGRVYATHGGAEGYHIEVGVFLKEESALETCVDGFHLGLLAEELSLGGDGNLQNLGLGIGLPPGVALAYLDLSTGELEHGTHRIGHILLARSGRAALREHNLHLTIGHAH